MTIQQLIRKLEDRTSLNLDFDELDDNYEIFVEGDSAWRYTIYKSEKY